MIKTAIMVFLLGFLTFSLDVCEPFGVRIYYGDVVVYEDSQEKVAIYFNTQDSCQDSYIQVLTKDGLTRSTCRSSRIQISSGFTTFVQKCSLQGVSFEQGFSYSVYGWNGNITQEPSVFSEEWILVKLSDPRKKQREMKLVVFADWAPIKNLIETLTPITLYLKRILFEDNIDAIIINGDVAYDLDTNNGTNYINFIKLMSSYSSRYPTIQVPGNHQHKSPDAFKLYHGSFKTYGLEQKSAVGISFGTLYLIPYDPYYLVYGLVEPVSSFDALKNELIKGKETGRFVIPLSHYPLICSAQSSQCQGNFGLLKEYFNEMVKRGVSLFVAAHTHSYQRNYPYYQDQSFKRIESPYNSDGNYLISIVQGVAGTDSGIMNVMPVVEDYTAKYTISQTGFGIIDANLRAVSYSHFSTKQGFMDQIQIVRPQKSSSLKSDTGYEYSRH